MMAKIKKTYRLKESAVNEIQEIKEMQEEKTGLILSDSQIIETALYEYWLNFDTGKGKMIFTAAPEGGKSFRFVRREKNDVD